MPRRPLTPEQPASIRADVVRGERELEAFIRGGAEARRLSHRFRQRFASRSAPRNQR